MIPRNVIMPVAIVVACAILGGFYYAVQVKKQDSIERQQQIDLDTKKAEDEAQTERDDKEYVAKRKNDCLDIFKVEDDKWNNVTGWRYDELTDRCKVEYKSDKPKSDEECDESYPTNTNSGLSWFWDNVLCKDGKFENSF